ncbi:MULTISPECIES: polysaccharide pyruvyl transferase family protein [Brevundimonas]|uniref:polysaccharide pyruvyl transferase family protein n=1 Tax=Brevundimonas TaxID=41275 RepID=UPI000F01909A|nr:polysaccharide pyruvyl transferase family protein [Brevundimonas lutea]
MTETDPIRLYWWAKKTNFGDLIGPWLVELMTGRSTENIRHRADKDGITGLATAGSLVHSLDRPGLEIWGAGSICALGADHMRDLADKEPARIHAVRGWRTFKELRKLGWTAPRVFGDPASLLPRFYAPRLREDLRDKVVLVPHYSHKPLFTGLADSRFHTVEVQDQPDVVVDQIASAQCVLSTSLHGVIVAQAYGVPWVWLRIKEAGLIGGDFKFEDYFTTIDRDGVRVATLDPGAINDLNIRAVSEFAYLPKPKLNFDDLLEAFPYPIRDGALL